MLPSEFLPILVMVGSIIVALSVMYVMSVGLPSFKPIKVLATLLFVLAVAYTGGWVLALAVMLGGGAFHPVFVLQTLVLIGVWWVATWTHKKSTAHDISTGV